MTTAVVVGSGPNGLAAAVTLARAGVEVTVLEAAPVPGGGTRSAELTLPGLVHDECSGFHPLAVDNPFTRSVDLGGHGLHWRWPEVQYSHPLDGGHGAAALRSIDETADGLGADRRAWLRAFRPLVERFDAITDDFMAPVVRIPDHPFALGRFGLRAAMPASLLARTFSTPEAKALFGGVAAHAFMPFHKPMTSAIGTALGVAAHVHGWPVAEGGSVAIANAMIDALHAAGGRVEVDTTVTSLDELGSPDIVLLDVAPAAAARIVGDRLPSRVRRALDRYRHGPGTHKVEFALDGPVPWQHEPSRRAGTVHVVGDFADTRRAESDVAAGRMPERPYVLVGQQYLADPSRARGTTVPLYTYAHVPHGYTGDATEAIEAQIERFAPGFRDRIVMRHVRGAVEMARHNPNYVGGDVVTGANDARQLVFRPRATTNPYALGVPGVYLCSAATPPGAGAHGMCGYNAAIAALAWAEPTRGASPPT